MQIYGLKHSSRNYGVYSQSSLHELYDKVCATLHYDVNENFVYPSVLPQGALYGWKSDFEMILWPRNDEGKKKADEMIQFMKRRGMITNTVLKEMKLVYKVVTEATHVAEMILTFEAEHEMFEEIEN